MNKIKIIKFIFITIIYTIFAYAENEGWDVKLDIIKDKFLPAEPIIITIQTTNNSNKEIRGFSATGHLFLDEKVCNQQHAVIEPATPPCPTCSGGTPKLYKPNENIIMNIRLNYICYGLWVDNSVEASFGFHKFCYRDENRDICKNFEIIHPIGEDEGAYKWLQSNGIRDLYESNKLDYILEKYPTSTYAGWALFSNSYIENLDLEKEYNSKIILIEKAKNASLLSEKIIYEKSVSSDIEFHKKRLQLIENYISVRPDHPIASWLMYEVAHHYGYLENWENSLLWAKKAIAIDKKSYAADKAEKLIKFVEKMMNHNDSK